MYLIIYLLFKSETVEKKNSKLLFSLEPKTFLRMIIDTSTNFTPNDFLDHLQENVTNRFFSEPPTTQENFYVV